MATQFAPGITGSLPYGEMHKLFDPNSGMDEKKIQDSLFFGKGDVSKEDIMKAYGKNAPQALDLVTKNLGEANGVWSWATVGLSRMAGNQGQDVNQYIAELQNLSTIIAEKNKLLEKQQADANTELRSQTNYLQIIA